MPQVRASGFAASSLPKLRYLQEPRSGGCNEKTDQAGAEKTEKRAPSAGRDREAGERFERGGT